MVVDPSVEIASHEGRDHSPITKSELYVVFCVDEQFLLSLSVVLSTLVRSLEAGSNIVIYILHEGIRPKDRRRVERSLPGEPSRAKIVWLSSNSASIEEFRSVNHLSRAAYLRLLVGDLMPAHISRVLYLDCDLIIRRNIRDLWEQNTDDFVLVAVQDENVPMIASPGGLDLTYKRLGLPPDAPCFNSGVMLINLAKWRSERVGEKALNYLRDNAQYIRWADQDALNAVLIGQWRAVDVRWNVQYAAWRTTSRCVGSSFADSKAAFADAFILHFSSGLKPWLPGSWDSPRAEFLQCLLRSGWFNWAQSIAFCGKTAFWAMNSRYHGMRAGFGSMLKAKRQWLLFP